MYNLEKLLTEMTAAGLPVTGIETVGDLVGGLAVDVRLHWADPASVTPEQLAQAEAIQAAHDPVDYEAQETEEGRTELRAQAVAVLADFHQALDNWATLTAAQQKAVLKRCVQVNVALIKLLRHIV